MTLSNKEPLSQKVITAPFGIVIMIGVAFVLTIGMGVVFIAVFLILLHVGQIAPN